jgi:hypothetical protein
MKKSELKELIRQVVKEENDYQQLFKHMLDKSGKSIADMSDEDKKKFFNAVDTAYKAKSEGRLTGYNEAELTAGQKKIDVDGDGEIEGLDLAKLRAKNESSFMDTDRKAAAISNVIQLDKKVIKKFIEDNNLDANKIHTFVQKNYPKNAESFVQLMKHPNNSSLKNFTNE